MHYLTVKWFYLFLLPIIGMQILAYTQGCKWLRLTENLLGLNSGPQKIFDLKIVLSTFPPNIRSVLSVLLLCETTKLVHSECFEMQNSKIFWG